MTIRCSDIDRVRECHGSLIPPKYPVDYSSRISSTGSACHRIIARAIGGANIADEIEAECACYRELDRREIEFLVWDAWRAWQKLSPMVPNPKVETRVQSFLVHGIADVLSIEGDDVVILDWKFGHSRDTHTGQLLGYASCGVHEVGGWRQGLSVKTIEVHVRHGEYDIREVRKIDVFELESDIIRAVKNPEGRWAPGRVCTYCPSRHECTALELYLQNSRWLLDSETSAPMTREGIGKLHDRAVSLKHALERYWDAVNACLDDGPLELDDGRVIQWKETRREEISLARGWPVLREAGVTAEALLASTRTSTTALKTTIGACAPRGQKGKLIDDVFTKLRAARAVKTTVALRRDISAPKRTEEKNV